MKKIQFLFAALFLSAMVLTSCDKLNSTDENQLPGDDMELADDEALVATVMDDATIDADLVDNDTELNDKSATMAVCRIVEREWSGDTLIITITYYPDDDCVHPYMARTRSGKVIIKRIGGHMFRPGATKIITFDNFYVNGIKVEGTKTIVSDGISSDTTSVLFHITVEGGKLTFPDTTVVTYEAQKTRLLYIGENWYDSSDDYWLIRGTEEGVNYNGDAYTTTITDLKGLFTCRYFVSGTISITVGENSPIIVDYGNGDCDPYATVTKDGVTEQITLNDKRLVRRFRFRR